MLQRRAGLRRVVEAEDARGPVAGEIADLRVVAVDDQLGVGQLRRPRRASAPRRARARRTGRAGRGTGCRGAARADAAGARPRGAHASSTSNSPSSAARAARRVEATPETRFAPEPLWATRTDGRRISATIAVVVVLPFVAETSADPRGSRAASASIAPGSSFQSSFPGSVVPPPRPARRESAPAARSTDASSSSASGGRIARTPYPGHPPGRLAFTCTSLSLLYHSCNGPEADAVPHVDPAALAEFQAGLRRRYQRRPDPRRAPPVGCTARPLADDEGVRRRSRGRGAPADGDRALRHLERREAGGRPAPAQVRDA